MAKQYYVPGYGAFARAGGMPLQNAAGNAPYGQRYATPALREAVFDPNEGPNASEDELVAELEADLPTLGGPTELRFNAESGEDEPIKEMFANLMRVGGSMAMPMLMSALMRGGK